MLPNFECRHVSLFLENTQGCTSKYRGRGVQITQIVQGENVQTERKLQSKWTKDVN
jgi:hypothetical protein